MIYQNFDWQADWIAWWAAQLFHSFNMASDSNHVQLATWGRVSVPTPLPSLWTHVVRTEQLWFPWSKFYFNTPLQYNNSPLQDSNVPLQDSNAPLQDSNPWLQSMFYTMPFVEEGQRGLLPPFLEFWPLELFQHFSNVTQVSPASTGPSSSSPLDLLYSINFCLVMGVPNWCCIVHTLIGGGPELCKQQPWFPWWPRSSFGIGNLVF